MYTRLKEINRRPELFESYTAETLWNDSHISKNMLEFHLNGTIDVASRKTAFIDKSVEWMQSRFAVGEQTNICDFGCGPGLNSTRLASLGARVTGIDFSENSIRYARETAREQGLVIDYVCQNYLEYETDQRFDLIIMIMCDFCALSPRQRSELLGKFHGMLSANGAVLLDVYSYAAFESREECAEYGHLQMNGFWSANDYYAFRNTFKYEREKVVLDKYTIIEENRSREVYNWLQYFSPESLAGEFGEAGFRIGEYYSDVAGKAFSADSPEFAVVATRQP